MNASIVTIGDEILIGQITDTNSVYIAKELDRIGISVNEIVTIADNHQSIASTLSRLETKSDFIVLTGGLGPTNDDVTKHVLVQFLDDQLILNQVVLEHVRCLIEKVYKKPISQVNKDQALVPSKAVVLFNALGTAPGLWCSKDELVIVSLPGVPYEMKHLIKDRVIPKLKQSFKLPYINHQNFVVYGVGETLVAEQLKMFEQELVQHKQAKLAYLPSPGLVKVRLSYKGDNHKASTLVFERLVEKLKAYLDIFDYFFDYDDYSTIESQVVNRLKTSGKSLAVAESCTGGAISKQLTSYPGVSSFYKGALVSYATSVKKKHLGVGDQVIADHSVVSLQVAEQMAKGALIHFNSDLAIATTGNAGPTKGESDQDLGVVCFAIASQSRVRSYRYNFGKSREKVIAKATLKAFELLIDFLNEK